jgi:predicted TIM-barrel fold metal-dependent hydrolase
MLPQQAIMVKEKIRRIDTHAHVFAASCAIAPGARYRPAGEAFVGEWLALQDAAGVGHGVLVQPSFLGTDNSYLLETLRAQPQRLRATVVVDPGIAPATLRQWDALGVRGIRLNTIGREHPEAYAKPEWQALFKRLADLGWHVEVHGEGAAMVALLGVLASCPARLVVDHFGRPDVKLRLACPGVQALLRAAETKSVYVKLSAPYRLSGGDAGAYAGFYLRRLGAERLLWGSDWPNTQYEGRYSYAQTLGWLEEWIGDEHARRAVLWDTPAELFRF